MGDVDVPSFNVVAHERRRTASHVGGKHGCGVAQTDAPPRLPVRGHVSVLDLLLLRESEESIHKLAFLCVEDIEVYGKVDHALETLGRCETFACAEELACFGH